MSANAPGACLVPSSARGVGDLSSLPNSDSFKKTTRVVLEK